MRSSCGLQLIDVEGVVRVVAILDWDAEVGSPTISGMEGKSMVTGEKVKILLEVFVLPENVLALLVEVLDVLVLDMLVLDVEVLEVEKLEVLILLEDVLALLVEVLCWA